MLTLIKIAFRNIFRNKRRSFLTIGAVFISVAITTFFISIFDGMYEMMIRNTVSSIGHIQIVHKTYYEKEKTMPLKYKIDNYSKVKEQILKNVDGVEKVAGRILLGGMLGKEDLDEIAGGFAIEPDIDTSMFNISKNIIEGRMPNKDRMEVLLGDKLAKRLRVKVGDEIIIVSKTVYNSLGGMALKVCGIAKFSVERMNNVFFIPLKVAQKSLYMEGAVSRIVIEIRHSRDVEKIKEKIKGLIDNDDYLVLSYLDNDALKSMITYLRVASFVELLIVFIIAIFGIFNTMFTSVFERTPEIGLLSSMGLTKYKIQFLFLSESGIIGIIGSIFGIMLGSVAAYYFATKGFNLGDVATNVGMDWDRVLYAEFSFAQILKTFLLGFIVSIIAGIIPAIKASRLEPTEALRKIG